MNGVIHVILAKYTIHLSPRTRMWLTHGAVFRMLLLPPYSPDDNRIDHRLKREEHAKVTVNHDALGYQSAVSWDQVVHRPNEQKSAVPIEGMFGRELRRVEVRGT